MINIKFVQSTITNSRGNEVVVKNAVKINWTTPEHSKEHSLRSISFYSHQISSHVRLSLGNIHSSPPYFSKHPIGMSNKQNRGSCKQVSKVEQWMRAHRTMEWRHRLVVEQFSSWFERICCVGLVWQNASVHSYAGSLLNWIVSNPFKLSPMCRWIHRYAFQLMLCCRLVKFSSLVVLFVCEWVCIFTSIAIRFRSFALSRIVYYIKCLQPSPIHREYIPFFWWMYFEFSIHIIYSHYIWPRLVVRCEQLLCSFTRSLLFSEYAINYLIWYTATVTAAERWWKWFYLCFYVICCLHTMLHWALLRMMRPKCFLFACLPTFQWCGHGYGFVRSAYTQSISTWLGNKQANTLILLRCLFNWPATMQWP